MNELGQILLQLARNAITARFGLPVNAAVDLPELHKMGATFVTLTQHDELRGCIGSLEAWRPLLADVQENACNAAFRDPPGTRLPVHMNPRHLHLFDAGSGVAL